MLIWIGVDKAVPVLGEKVNQVLSAKTTGSKLKRVIKLLTIIFIRSSLSKG